MKAFVFAAGLGSRLLPLTQTLPKAMFPVMNRPILEHTLNGLLAHGIKDAVVNLHHLPETVAQHFGGGEAWGMRLTYSREETILGTAGGLKAARTFLEDGTFLAVNSDIVADIDLKKVVDYHKQKRAILTLVLIKNRNPKFFAPIATDAEGRIVQFPGVPGPRIADDGMMFTGVQVMEPEIFSHIPSQGFCGTTEKVFPKMIREGLPVYGYTHAGYWMDVGRRENYLQAHWDILDGKTAVRSGKSRTPLGGGNTIPPAFVGADCHISPNAAVGPYVILGDGCKVEDGAVVERSVCWGQAVIRNKATVRDSIIGTGVVALKNSRIVGRSAAVGAEGET